ncbi:MAG: hypothetical protein CMC79_01205 [Flavobacteriaceae bacterium]|nr:hypothetical protein [Flavobacteriaceae bacterium]|tara:strand:- start:3870 stop:5888 length:2019 start_codon:yes stop_codon:yes gene_type:complete
MAKKINKIKGKSKADSKIESSLNLDFSNMKVVDLRALAKKNRITGISKMKKADIISVLYKINSEGKNKKGKKSSNKTKNIKKVLDKKGKDEGGLYKSIILLKTKIKDPKWYNNKNDIQFLIDKIEKLFLKEKQIKNKDHLKTENEKAKLSLKSKEKIEFENILFKYRKIKRNHFKDLEAQKKLNGEHKKEIIEEIKKLIGSDKSINVIYKKFKSLQEKWHKTGPALRIDNNNLWETYKHHVERFYDFLHINRELRDIDYKHNYEEKIKIIEQAEKLAKISDIHKASRELNNLHRLWKSELGPVFPKERESLWKRFQAASKLIHNKRQDFQKNITQNYSLNLDAKNNILNQLKSLTKPIPSTHKDWQKKIKTFNDLREEFKKIGPVIKDQSKSSWNNFRKIGRDFNYNKNQFYKDQKKTLRENINNYSKLINEISSILEKKDWKDYIQRVKNMQLEYKDLGFIPKNQAKKLNKEFYDKMNLYFKRLKSGYEKLNAKEENIYNNKFNKIKELNKIKVDKKTLVESIKKEWDIILSIGKLDENNENKILNYFLKESIKIIKDSNIEKENLDETNFIIELYCLETNIDNLKIKIEKYKKTLDTLNNQINQLENNIEFFSQSSTDSPMLKEVTKKLKLLSEKSKVLNERIKKLKSLEKKLLKPKNENTKNKMVKSEK